MMLWNIIAGAHGLYAIDQQAHAFPDADVPWEQVLLRRARARSGVDRSCRHRFGCGSVGCGSVGCGTGSVSSRTRTWRMPSCPVLSSPRRRRRVFRRHRTSSRIAPRSATATRRRSHASAAASRGSRSSRPWLSSRPTIAPTPRVRFPAATAVSHRTSTAPAQGHTGLSPLCAPRGSPTSDARRV